MKKDRKTRPLKGASDWKCPIHKCPVKHQVRMRTDERTGKEKYSGEYFMCPQYGECRYYVSPGDATHPAHVAVVL